MKTYIGVLALVLGTLLSYGIAWHLDSDAPPERPSRRLLDNRGVAASGSDPRRADSCSSLIADPDPSVELGIRADSGAGAAADPASPTGPTQPTLPASTGDSEPNGCEVRP